jgi:protein-disulfide isomerase
MAKGGLTLPVGSRDHAQGPIDAQVTLVEYGDYECPHCGYAYGIVKAVQKHFGPMMRFVFRNFPLREMHPHAEAAAEAAEAAGAQGKFWEMHDYIFENQAQLGGSALAHHAQRLALDMARWAADVRQNAFIERIQEDFLSGMRSGVNGTPTFFINGRRHDGLFDEKSLVQAMQPVAASV